MPHITVITPSITMLLLSTLMPELVMDMDTVTDIITDMLQLPMVMFKRLNTKLTVIPRICPIFFDITQKMTSWTSLGPKIKMTTL